jgi:ABC-type bacteriocin/lantibiotic exporter with double-glycine peptidase domain
MVAEFFGKKLASKKIMDACGAWKEEGMSNEDLVRALDTLGFKTKPSYESAWENLISENTKGKVIIVSWMLKGYIGHFSVVERVNDKRIWLAEPESGEIVSMEKIVFLRLWLDYGESWYPEKVTDFKLRWMVVVGE